VTAYPIVSFGWNGSIGFAVSGKEGKELFSMSSRSRKPNDLPADVLSAKRALFQHLLTNAPDLEEAGNLMRDLQSLLHPPRRKPSKKPGQQSSTVTS
jgi:hypothetical protein